MVKYLFIYACGANFLENNPWFIEEVEAVQYVKVFVLFVSWLGDKMINENENYIHHGRIKEPIRVLNIGKNIEDDITKVLITINFTGFVCIDFKIVNNKIKIFEINPRLGETIVYNDLPEFLDLVFRL